MLDAVRATKASAEDHDAGDARRLGVERTVKGVSVHGKQAKPRDDPAEGTKAIRHVYGACMSQTWTTEPITRPIEATVKVPGSKSLTNRALVLAALASGPCELSGVLFADDTRHMLDNLKTLGMSLDISEAEKTVRVDTPASPDFATGGGELFCGNSGTTIRFLSGLLAAVGEGTFVLDGVERMRQRPIGPLVDLLNSLAGSPVVLSESGYPPITINSTGLQGGDLNYPAGTTLSSQFLSAALMAALYARREVRLDLDGLQASWPYVKMTMRLMDVFGVTPEVELDEEDESPAAIIVPRGRYGGTDYAIEPDASAASYFLGLAAIHAGSRVTLAGLGSESLQGDARFADVLGRMGCTVKQSQGATTLEGPSQLNGIDVDMSEMPDCAQTLAVVALFAAQETTIRGLKTLRVKETDRVAALEAELTKLGGEVRIDEGDGDIALTITPPARIRGASIATYDDHRMAMSFALAATKRRGVEIEEAGCVSKTYPGFFEHLDKALQSVS